MPKLTIDNREVEVPDGTKVIDAAAQVGIVIPRFCFHPALGAVGACRVCAVAFLEGPVKGIQMSCMVDALDGMVVSTTDPEAVDFRKHVIEWLMLNHPHDCPVCDEGGHCLLQDTTVAGGHGMRRYQGLKRTHRDQYLGPLVQHEMNRCIQCYRCSRYYQQYSGYRDLGVMGIGSRVYFGRSAPGALESPFAGNLIDICPTGVYTDKPSRFFGRRWDFERAPSICIHCSSGCNLTVSARYRQVVRHEARLNPDVNGHFICDRGRFAVPYANRPDRPRQARVDGASCTLPEAVGVAADRLRVATERSGTGSVAVIGSARSSLETITALNAICRRTAWAGPVYQTETRSTGANHSAVDAVTPDTMISLNGLATADAVVVVGADPLNEAPMVAMALRQAHRHGAPITVIDPRPVDLPMDVHHIPVPLAELENAVSRLAAAADPGISEAPRSNRPRQPWEDALESLSGALCRSQQPVVVCGTGITTPGEVAAAVRLTHALKAAGAAARFYPILDGPNAFAAGHMPDRQSRLSLTEVIDAIEAGSVTAVVIVESDLWSAFPDRARLQAALDRLELVVVMDYVDSPLLAWADVVLPTQTIYEAGGGWVTPEGRLQKALPVLAGGEPAAITGQGGHPPRVFAANMPGASPVAAWRLVSAMTGDAMPEARDADRWLAAALESMGLSGIDGGTGPFFLALPKDSITKLTDTQNIGASGPIQMNAVGLLVVDWALGTEPLSALAPALAEATPPPVATMHPLTAAEFGLTDLATCAITTDKGQVSLPVACDDRMARGLVVVPRHHQLDWQIFDGTRTVLDPGQIVEVHTAAEGGGA